MSRIRNTENQKIKKEEHRLQNVVIPWQRWCWDSAWEWGRPCRGPSPPMTGWSKQIQYNSIRTVKVGETLSSCIQICRNSTTSNFHINDSVKSPHAVLAFVEEKTSRYESKPARLKAHLKTSQSQSVGSEKRHQTTVYRMKTKWKYLLIPSGISSFPYIYLEGKLTTRKKVCIIPLSPYPLRWNWRK